MSFKFKQRRFAYIFIISVFIFSCENKEKSMPESRFDLHAMLKNYCVGGHLKGMDAFDENAILFGKEHRWDTSFVVMIRKDGANFSGVYYETNPENELLSVAESNLYFYNGFSFKFDSVSWNQILNETKAMISQPNHDIDMSCVDCESYVLVHNKQYTLKASQTSGQFKKFSKLLKTTLIKPIYEIRQKRLIEVYGDSARPDSLHHE